MSFEQAFPTKAGTIAAMMTFLCESAVLLSVQSDPPLSDSGPLAPTAARLSDGSPVSLLAARRQSGMQKFKRRNGFSLFFIRGI